MHISESILQNHIFENIHGNSRHRHRDAFFCGKELLLGDGLSVTIRNQPSYAGKKISRVIREIFCNNKEASA